MPKKEFSPVSKREQNEARSSCIPMVGLYRFKQQEKKIEFLLENGGLTASPAETTNSNPHLANQQQVLHFAVPFMSVNKLCKNAELELFC
jgi:hypothetical protein